MPYVTLCLLHADVTDFAKSDFMIWTGKINVMEVVTENRKHTINTQYNDTFYTD